MITAEEAFAKPLPSPDGDTEALWGGLRDGKLLLQHCNNCGNVAYYQQQMCRRCGSEDIAHTPASGAGKVHSFSVVYRAPGPAFKADVPYAVLLVELAEGPRMISTFTGGSVDEVTFDMPVQLAFEDVGGNITLPRFRKA